MKHGATRAEGLRVGIAGLGSVAQVHLGAYAGLQGIVVVAGADPDAGARARAAERFGVRVHPTSGAMLASEELDLLCVLSSVNTHRGIVEDAVRQGVAVLCEKPLAVSVADAVAMEEASRRAGVPLFYGSSYRFLSPIVEARRLVAEGRIGRVDLVVETLLGGRGPAAQQAISSEHYPAGGPGGTGMGIVDHGVHFFDLVPWLVGARISTVLGRGNRTGAPLRPEFAVLTLEGGTEAHILCWDGTWSTKLPNEGSWSAGDGWGVSAGFTPGGSWARDTVELHVHGSEGALRVIPYAHHLFLTDADGCRELPLPGRPAPGHFATQLEAVAAALAGEPSRAVPARAGIDALLVLEALYESGRCGAAQHVPPAPAAGHEA